MLPISDAAAIAQAGLSPAEARRVSDEDLLRFPTIGRRTLAWLRSLEDRA